MAEKAKAKGKLPPWLLKGDEAAKDKAKTPKGKTPAAEKGKPAAKPKGKPF